MCTCARAQPIFWADSGGLPIKLFSGHLGPEIKMGKDHHKTVTLARRTRTIHIGIISPTVRFYVCGDGNDEETVLPAISCDFRHGSTGTHTSPERVRTGSAYLLPVMFIRYPQGESRFANRLSADVGLLLLMS